MNKILKIFIKDDCRTCRLVKMKMDTVSKEPYMITKIKYINVDKNEAEALAYDIQSVPALILLDDDRIIWRHMGNINYHDLRNNIEA